jgi:hypoxanthine phosphoribosyltransferase
MHRFISWEDVEEDCLTIYANMRKDNYTPDVILGLLRGGVVPSRIFLDLHQSLLDFCSIDVKLYDGINLRGPSPKIRSFIDDIKGKKILIVDDIWDSGKTMNAVLEYLKGYDITTATLYWREKASQKPNYYSKIAPEGEWQIFPWEKYEFWRLINEKQG